MKRIIPLSILFFLLITGGILPSGEGLNIHKVLSTPVLLNKGNVSHLENVKHLNSKEKIQNCRFKGFNLYGKVKIVNDFPDIKVKIVENFPDLKVNVVENFADECGKWKFVDNFPDIKVQFVENFPDLKVKFVENFPGVVK